MGFWKTLSEEPELCWEDTPEPWSSPFSTCAKPGSRKPHLPQLCPNFWHGSFTKAFAKGPWHGFRSSEPIENSSADPTGRPPRFTPMVHAADNAFDRW